MVRSCQAEQQVSDYFDTLIRQRIPAQVGLLIGKRSVGSRDLLLSVIRTPLQDGQDPVQCTASGPTASTSKPSGSKSKASAAASGASGGVSVFVDSDWVAVHAAQVARMLPGGLSVLGTYIFCPESGLQSAVDQLSTVLSDLNGRSKDAASARAAAASTSRASGETDDVLLLHVDSVTKKLSLKELDPSAPKASGSRSSSARPCELKLAPCINSLVCLTCDHQVEVTLTVPDGKDQLREQLAAAVAAECSRIEQSVVLVPGSSSGGGSVPPDSAQVMDSLSSASQGPAAGKGLPSCSVQLLSPLPSHQAATGTAGGAGAQPGVSCVPVQGRVVLRGTVHGLAYVHKRELFGKAADDLKADLQSSLRSRMDLLLEDAYAWEEEQQEQQQAGQGQQQPTATRSAHPLLKRGPLAKGAVFVLPRRVVLPWKATGLSLCDYLLPGEEVEASAERAAELLGLHLSDPIAEVAQVEAAEPVQAKGGHQQAPQPWRPLGGVAGTAAKGSKAMTTAAAGGPQGGKGQGVKSGGSSSSCVSMAMLGGASVAVVLLAVGLGAMSLGVQQQ